MLKGILRTDLFNCSHLGMTTDDDLHYQEKN